MIGEASRDLEAGRRFFQTLASGLLLVLSLSMMLVWVQSSYLSSDPFRIISWVGADPPCGLSAPWTLGHHHFGDYALPWLWLQAETPWSADTCIPANYPAATLVPHSLLSVLPYRSGLIIYLGLMAACLLGPFWWASRGAGWQVRLGVLSVVSVTAPVLVTLDRGSTTALIVPALTVFAWAWTRGRWSLASGAVAVAAAIKVYPAILWVAPLVNRKWRQTALSVVACGAASILIWALYPGSVAESIGRFVDTVSYYSDPTPAIVARSNYSLLGGVVALAELTPGVGWAALIDWLLNNPWLPGAVYLAGCAVLIHLRRGAHVAVIALTLASVQLVAPVTYRYYSAFVLAVVALLVRDYLHPGESALAPPSGGGARWRRGLLAMCLIATMAPLPLPASSPAGAYPMQAVIAGLWATLLVVELITAALDASARGRVRHEATASRLPEAARVDRPRRGPQGA